MILSLLIFVLSALLGTLCQVVNVEVPIRKAWSTTLGDDFFFAFNLCETQKHAPACYQIQLICEQNFLFPNQYAQILLRINYKLHYMGETIDDTLDFPVNLTTKYNSFVFRVNKDSEMTFQQSINICKQSDAEFWNPTCHYMCHFRGWNVTTNKEVQQEEAKIRWVSRIAGEKNSGVARLGTISDTSRRCIPSPNCLHGTCLMHDGVVYPNTCECQAGWYGTNCDRDSVCLLANLCQDGTCRKSPQSPSGLKCDCKPGFYGEYCDQSHAKPKFCRKDSDCQNGGKCVQRSEKPNFCKCHPDFVGNHCETPLQCPNSRS